LDRIPAPICLFKNQYLGTTAVVTPFEILLTTGDADGIGVEVAAKALRHLRAQLPPTKVFLNQRSVSQFKKFFSEGGPFRPGPVELVQRSSAPSEWVFEASWHCMKNLNARLVTGPLSKSKLKASNGYLGHTGILKLVTKTDDLFMGFLGEHWNVVLTTDHISLRDVPRLLTPKKLRSSVAAAEVLARKFITPKRSPKKSVSVGVLGLNPHAGESGLIGKEETRWINRQIKSLSSKSCTVVGPLSPDSAFPFGRKSPHDVFVALYHDQGLAPFKLVHGHSGVHVTLGLPFFRSSVDHGTAKDLFNKGTADPTSMILALKAAMQWTF
jgi:4-hydroxy-L-threonine phosphate dehydrogenase PdxA